jgi:energy-coupling factor transporter transmembrane protein EcfT
VSRAARHDRPAAGAIGTAPVLAGAMVGALIAGRVETAALCIGVATLAALAARAGWPRRTWWQSVGGGCALALVLNLLLVAGTRLPLALPFGLVATREGLASGVLLALRLLGAGIAVHGLRRTWRGDGALDEMARALRPLERLRLPVREARAMVWLALRFAPLLASETRRIGRIQDLRAGAPARGWRERLARGRAVVVPAMVGALERAERVALALEARHYRVRPLPAWRPPGAGAALGLGVAGAALLWRS